MKAPFFMKFELSLQRYLQNNTKVSLMLIMNFAYFKNLRIKIPHNCENYMKPVEAFGNNISKCPIINVNKAPLLLHTVLLHKNN